MLRNLFQEQLEDCPVIAAARESGRTGTLLSVRERHCFYFIWGCLQHFGNRRSGKIRWKTGICAYGSGERTIQS